MFPENDGVPADLSRLPALCGVIDAIYNPLNTRLILNARERGIAAEGGLFMLCAQAVRASEIFHDRKLPPDTADRIFRAIRSEKENVVLIGMPAVGKSTVGKLLSRESGRPFFDADEEFEKKNGQIFAFFAKYGESAFRDEETRILKELSKHSGAILSTGGGSVLRQENIASLKQNGRLFWLDRDLRDITPDPHRPTANSRAAIEALYRERIDFYRRAADEIVTIGARNGEPDFSAATEQILNARRKQYDAP